LEISKLWRGRSAGDDHGNSVTHTGGRSTNRAGGENPGVAPATRGTVGTDSGDRASERRPEPLDPTSGQTSERGV